VLAQVLGALSFGALLAALRLVSGGVWPRPVSLGPYCFSSLAYIRKLRTMPAIKFPFFDFTNMLLLKTELRVESIVRMSV